MNKIRRGDEVAILSGRDKGGRGAVLKVYVNGFGKPEKVLVQGINMGTHYVRPNPQQNEPGGIIRREMPLHISNVAPIDPESGQPARVKIEEKAAQDRARNSKNAEKMRHFYVPARRRKHKK